MEVAEVVAETLKQVIDGVRTAQSHEMGRRGCLGSYPGDYAAGLKNGPIAFKLAVTVVKESSAGATGEAGSKIEVMGVNLGGAKVQGTVETGRMEQVVSHVEFEVPITWPASV